MKKINPINLIFCTLKLFEEELEKIEEFETITTRREIINHSVYDLSEKTVSRYMAYIKSTFSEYKDRLNLDIEVSKKGYKAIRRDKTRPIK